MSIATNLLNKCKASKITTFASNKKLIKVYEFTNKTYFVVYSEAKKEAKKYNVKELKKVLNFLTEKTYKTETFIYN